MLMLTFLAILSAFVIGLCIDRQAKLRPVRRLARIRAQRRPGQ